MSNPGYVRLPSTTHFTFEYSQNWSQADGEALGAALTATVEKDYEVINSWFGNLTPSGLPFNVQIEQVPTGTGLDAYASNDGHKNIVVNLGLNIKQAKNVDRAREVLVAEFVEILMVTQNTGWLPGQSHGEGLSRFAAFTRYPQIAQYWGGCDFWLDKTDPSRPDQPRRPDWVSKTKPTDVDAFSHGCALLFIYYLNTELGHPPSSIVAAAASTLQGVYKTLSGDVDAFPPFSALLAENFPLGSAGRIVGSLNPFPLSVPYNPPSFVPGDGAASEPGKRKAGVQHQVKSNTPKP